MVSTILHASDAMKRSFTHWSIVAAFVVQSSVIIVSGGNAASYISCHELGPKWRDVSGEWIASVGPLVFSVNALHVSGIYNKDTWSLDLRYSDDRRFLFGRWSHRNGLEGPVIFQLNQAGCINHARWGGSGSAVCNKQDSLACVYVWAFHGRAKK